MHASLTLRGQEDSHLVVSSCLLFMIVVRSVSPVLNPTSGCWFVATVIACSCFNGGDGFLGVPARCIVHFSLVTWLTFLTPCRGFNNGGNGPSGIAVHRFVQPSLSPSLLRCLSTAFLGGNRSDRGSSIGRSGARSLCHRRRPGTSLRQFYALDNSRWFVTTHRWDP